MAARPELQVPPELALQLGLGALLIGKVQIGSCHDGIHSYSLESMLEEMGDACVNMFSFQEDLQVLISRATARESFLICGIH